MSHPTVPSLEPPGPPPLLQLRMKVIRPATFIRSWRVTHRTHRLRRLTRSILMPYMSAQSELKSHMCTCNLSMPGSIDSPEILHPKLQQRWWSQQAAPNLVLWGSSWATTALGMSALELRCLVSAWQQLLAHSAATRSEKM